MKSISVIIPVYNEEASVTSLYREVVATLALLGLAQEIIFVNDGSTDGTLAVLKTLESVHIIDLNRNYGQTTALDAGFKAASGDLIISMDGDGQNDPQDIPRMIKHLQAGGYDVVAGWRTKRQDPSSVQILTRMGRLLRQLFIADPVHDAGCTLRVYTRAAVKSLDIGGEMHRYITALLRFRGFSVGELEVHHRPRTAGESKYGSDKAVRGFIDLLYIWFIYKYSQRPLHLFGYLSIVSFAMGVLAALWTLYNYFAMGIHFARDVWVVVSLFFFIVGVLFFSFGIVIDLALRIYLNTSPIERRYYVRAIIRT